MTYRRVLSSWLAVVLALQASSIEGFSHYHLPQGKGSSAYIMANSHSYRTNHAIRRPASHLYLNPANMMAKLSSDLIASVEDLLESPDFTNLWLKMDDRTIFSIIIYSFVFWVGMFVATSSDDINTPPAKPPVSNKPRYTPVATNPKTQWNMENERIQKVNNMWKKRERLGTINESITYHRKGSSESAAHPRQAGQVAAYPQQQSYHQTTTSFPTSTSPTQSSYPPPVNTVGQASYPPPVDTIGQANYAPPPPAMSPPPSHVNQGAAPSYPNHSPAPAPPISNAQYMAGLGSTSSVKQSYAVHGPNYSNFNNNAPKRSYKMTKWTPDQPVAPTNLYLANMSGPNRPALGSVELPMYFSPNVIPDILMPEEMYYEQEEEEYYDDEYDGNDVYYSIPQGKGTGRSYSMTRWKPDMRVNNSGPGANAYLSNMQQPAYRYDDRYTTSNGLMTGFPSMVSTGVSNGPYAKIDDINGYEQYANESANGLSSGVTNGAVNGQEDGTDLAAFLSNGRASMANEDLAGWQSEPNVVSSDDGLSSIPRPPSPAPYQPSFAASTIGDGNTATKKSYSMTSWKPGSAAPSGSVFGNSYLSKMAASQTEDYGHSSPPLNYESPTLDSMQPLSTTIDDLSAPQMPKKSYSMTSWKPDGASGSTNGSYLSTIAAPRDFPPSYTTHSPLTPHAVHEAPTPPSYQPSFASTTDCGGVEAVEKSYGMSNWKPGSPTPVGTGFGNSYLSTVNSLQAGSPPSVTPSAYEPPVPTPYQPSFASTENENQETQPIGQSTKSYRMTTWTPDSVTRSAFGNSYLSGMNSARNNNAPRPQEIGEPPVPAPYQPSFARYPDQSVSGWQRGTPSDSIIGNPYFGGMGSSYGNAEAPQINVPSSDDDWRQAGPPIWGVPESETPKQNHQMQMQA